MSPLQTLASQVCNLCFSTCDYDYCKPAEQKMIVRENIFYYTHNPKRAIPHHTMGGHMMKACVCVCVCVCVCAGMC